MFVDNPNTRPFFEELFSHFTLQTSNFFLQGRLAFYNRGGAYHELKERDRIKVDTGEHWIEMEVKRDYEGYYLESDRIAFYPKIVYAKTLIP